MATRAADELREQFEGLLVRQQEQFSAQLESVAATIGSKDIIPVSGGENLGHFAGKLGESFEEWLKRFNRLAKANNWTPEKKRDIFPWFLRGLAQQKYGQNFDTRICHYCRKQEDYSNRLPSEATNFNKSKFAQLQ